MITLTLLFALLFNDPGLESKWKDVDQLLQQGKPASALKIVEDIYAIASQNNAKPDLFRAILYKQKISFQIEEIEFAELIQRTEEQLAKQSDDEVKALMQSTVAAMYLQYLRRNYYRLQDRMYLNALPNDINQWSIRDLEERADALSIASVSKQAGTQTSLEDYKSMFSTEVKEHTLYEFLLMEGIRHFQNDLSYMTGVQDASTITSSQAFLERKLFVKQLETFSTELNQRKDIVFKQYAKLLQYLEKERAVKTAKIDLLRLQYAKSKFNRDNQPNIASDYCQALMTAYQTIQDVDAKALYGLYLAKAYVSIGRKYKEGFDQQYVDFYTKAMSVLSSLSPQDKEIKQAIASEKALLLQQELNVQFDEVISPIARQLINIDIRNINTLAFTIVKLTTSEYIDYSRRQRDENVHRALKNRTSVAKWTESLSCSTSDYQFHSTEIFLPELAFGQYALLIADQSKGSTSGLTKAAFFQVSDLDMLSWKEGKDLTTQIVSRYTGSQLSGCTVELFDMPGYRQPPNGKSIYSTMTDKRGQASLSFDRNRSKYAIVSHGDDKLYVRNIYNYQQHTPTKQDQAFVFLDRSIYRPGQRIQGKLLAVEYNADQMPSVLTNESLNITLYDANGQVVEEQTAMTNSYGAVQFAFNVPNEGLKGNYSINVGMSKGNGYKSIKVEEYRRPKYELTFHDNDDPSIIGDVVNIYGSLASYSGFPSQGAQIAYVIKETPYYNWYRCGWERMWYPPQRQARIVTTGNVVTDSQGEYNIQFQSEYGQEESRKLGVQYTIESRALDASGEQVTQSKTIYLTKSPFRLQHTIPSIITADSDISGAIIEGRNFEDQAIEVTSTIKIAKYKVNGTYKKRRNYQTDCQQYTDSEFSNISKLYDEQSSEPSEVLDPSFSVIETTLSDLSKVTKQLKAGKYQFEIIAKDSNNNAVSDKYNILLAGKSMSSPTELGFAPSSTTTVKVGQSYSPQLLLHNSTEQVYFQKIRGAVVAAQGWLTREEWVRKKFEITEQDQGGFTLNVFTWWKTDVFRASIQVEVPFENTYLDVSLDVEETLEPGADYTLDVNTAVGGNPIGDVEVTAVMYDASLDAIYPHAWQAQFYPTFYSSLNVTNHSRELAQSWFMGNWSRPSRTDVNLNYLPYTQWYGIVNPQHAWSNQGGRVMQRSKSMPMSASPESAEMDMNTADYALPSGMPSGQNKESITDVEQEPKVRSNFSETMFFITNSHTNNSGNANIDFTANDALTKWKMLVFAHDKQMRYGFAEQTVVSKKTIQLIQNPTRTLTEGDKILYPITIQNNSEQPITDAQVSINVQSILKGLDVTNDFVLDPTVGPISLGAMEAHTLFYEFNVPRQFKDAISIVTTVLSSVGNDAEAQVIPVLSSQKYLTEGHSIWAGPMSTEAQVISAIANGATVGMDNVYVELTTNPFWLVARSFPTLAKNSTRVTTSLVDNLFIETIAQDILVDHPRIEQVYSQQIVQKEGNQLDRNADLKLQTLNNTPWVRQAAAAKNQVADFAQYFNTSESANRLKQLQTELRQRQQSNGGLPWVDGGRANVYTTLYTLVSMAKLHSFGLFELDQEFVSKALDYSNQELQRIWDKVNKTSQISTLFIDHLYLMSMLPDDYKSPGFTKQTYAKLQKDWLSYSLAYQATAGIIFFNAGDDKLADAVKASLVERMITRDDGTIFWRGVNEYYSYHNDYATQALVLQFLDHCSLDPSILDKGTQWLIANKRSNEWYNDRGTSEVVHYLFNKYGANTAQQEDITLKINNNVVELKAGLTFSTVQLDLRIGESLINLELDNTTSLPIFGGLYRQYFQEASQIESHGQDELSIKKTVYKQTRTEKSMDYVPIATEEIVVGDKLRIRLTIEVFDRMSYVYISDQRPSGTEPSDVLSTSIYKNGMYGYQSPSDIGMEYFMEVLPKGTHTLEYDVLVTQAGSYSGGLAEIQSFYVPEFSAFDGCPQLSVTLSEKSKR